MTGNKLLLDTNIVIDLFKKNQKVESVIASCDQVFIPVMVLGELYLGAYRSLQPLKKLEEINDFLATCTLLDSNEQTANHYASTKATLLKKGRPIPENDIWIAATAFQYNLPLFTYDAHFREVEDLQLFNPLTPV